MGKELPAQKRLLEVFRYDAETGKLFNRFSRGSAREGAEAGCVDGMGYRHVGLDGVRYLSHRVIWKMFNGSDPVDDMDHINHDKLDNRIENLREVSRQENLRNASKRTDNTSGVTGVCWHKANEKWSAYIKVEGKRIHLGYFIQRWHAIRARKLAEIGHGFHANHGT